MSGVLAGRPETRARVLTAATDLGYRPSGVARSLKLGSTGTLGLIVTDILNPFYPELVRAIEDAARSSGLAVVLCNGQEDADREAAYLELLAARRVDGVVIASGSLSERHGRWLADAPLPVVLVNCRLENGSRPAILTDNRAAARIAVEHLLGLGHRRIAHITGRPVDAATEERLAGVRDALDAAGLLRDDLVVLGGDGHASGGERAMARLRELAPDVTAVACYNDLTAIGVLGALRRNGLRVPGDISVVGFDDVGLASLVDPPLTTVAQDIGAMGRWAVAMLSEAVSRNGGGSTGDVATAEVILPARLVVRGSTGPPPGAG
jgi:DNA-binding LacI/PurR family transcriptional regulator